MSNNRGSVDDAKSVASGQPNLASSRRPAALVSVQSRKGGGDFAALLAAGSSATKQAAARPVIVADLRRSASSGARSTHSQDTDMEMNAEPAAVVSAAGAAQQAHGLSASLQNAAETPSVPQTSTLEDRLTVSGQSSESGDVDHSLGGDSNSVSNSASKAVSSDAGVLAALNNHSNHNAHHHSLPTSEQDAPAAQPMDPQSVGDSAGQAAAALVPVDTPQAANSVAEASGRPDETHDDAPPVGVSRPDKEQPSLAKPRPSDTAFSPETGNAANAHAAAAASELRQPPQGAEPAASSFASLADMAAALPADTSRTDDADTAEPSNPQATSHAAASPFEGVTTDARSTPDQVPPATARATVSDPEPSEQPSDAGRQAAAHILPVKHAPASQPAAATAALEDAAADAAPAAQHAAPREEHMHRFPAVDELMRQPTPQLPLLSAASISQGPSRYAGEVVLPSHFPTQHLQPSAHAASPANALAKQPAQPIPQAVDREHAPALAAVPAAMSRAAADAWQTQRAEHSEVPGGPAEHGEPGSQIPVLPTAQHSAAQTAGPSTTLPVQHKHASSVDATGSAHSLDETPELSSRAESESDAVSTGEAASIGDFELVERDQDEMERSRQSAVALSHAVHEAASTSGQNESDAAWRQQRKHMFILSNAGKPVFSVHGDENALAGFMAVIQAMMSFVQDRGDKLHSIRAGRHLFMFVEKGPFYLVAVSATGEPEAALKLQLDLLYGQILSILTNGMERRFASNPRYDARKLLGGTGTVLRSLVDSFESDPSAMLGAYQPLPISATLRHSAVMTLQAAVKGSGSTWGVLLAGRMVVALAQPRASPLHPLDLLLLSNFVRATESFRQAESFSPVCLPHFQPSGHMHAYVHYLRQEAELCLVLLSSQPEQFYAGCAEVAQAAHDQLGSTGVIQGVAAGMRDQAHRGYLHIADLPKAAGGGAVGTTPLLHFLLKLPGRQQFVMPAISAPLDTPGACQALMPAYARVHAAMFREAEGGLATGLAPQRVHYSQDNERTLLAYVSPEYEVYAVFDALTEKPVAVQTCHKLCSWIKSQQADLFAP